ncbi:hypothetical protein SKAU_G00292300 [Synaphobranchus kaupii]|uniref:SMP-LTD domain-containing protein n=1 Tax=Synaphobranchus kaupii TaxID=118154 RepID=A0A9Q1ETZ9_SYNKA|nr:hypothetical protein SKAU_G00292300 [Synaphobranchus kaupii]
MAESAEKARARRTPHSDCERHGAGLQGIVIQLTGAKGAGEDSEESDCVFLPDQHEDTPLGTAPPRRRAPPSPVLSDRSASAPAFLSPYPSSPKPLLSLVKSFSTEIDPKEASSSSSSPSSSSSLRPKPLLSLVKSLSSEISRREPEVAQSKSDSKLNLHMWKQLTQPRAEPEGGDQQTAPPTPADPSPTEPEPRGTGFFKAELEDTRRKFSEAMQEPLSMLSKIIREDSPKQQHQHQQRALLTDNVGGGARGGAGFEGGAEDSDAERVEKQGRRAWRARFATPSPSPTPAPAPAPIPALSQDSRYEICTYGDVIQVVEIAGPRAGGDGGGSPRQAQGPRGLARPSISGSGRWLFCVSALAYSFFVLPLPSYLAGLALGLAGGFMLGLLVVLLLAPRRSSLRPYRVPPSLQDSLRADSPAQEHSHPKILKGWMNEIQGYNPEMYHPSLTHSVYATLEGSRLQLAYPRTNISRRATFQDPAPDPAPDAVFMHSRQFQLAGSKVFLLPAVLARKRVWNKKYPICVMLAEEEAEEEVEVGEEDRGEVQEEQGERAEQDVPPVAKPGAPVALFLFGRTGREKEEWFQHFLSASKATDCDQDSGSKSDMSVQQDSTPAGQAQYSGGSSRGSSEDIPSLLRLKDLAGSVREKILLDYNAYMDRFVVSEAGSDPPSPSYSTGDSPTAKEKFCEPVAGGNGESQPAVTRGVNALIGRIFWDFLREKYWANQVAHKIQKKLTKIRLPYFMNELTLTELDMGTCMPQVVSMSRPSVDHRGLWLEMEVVYTGSLQMTLETKMNLCKLGKEGGAETDSVPESGCMSSRPRLCVLADSDEESSSAGSSDEEEVPPSEPQGVPGDKGTPPGADGHGGCSTSRKILRFVDKIAKSKYFQKATENEYIKKKIEEVSNTPLLLTVEVQELSGTLAVNIPPPPTDRIWYSFRVPPRLDLRVRPMLGEREVTFTHVTEWIEKKLQREFQKVLVMPNMDDLYLPLMHSGLDSPPSSQHSPASCSRESSMDVADQEEEEAASE